MSLITRQLEEVWNALRASNIQRRHILQEIRIRNLRGIKDLRVPFDYPVCVLAGPNGCGKSTVLFACACAYRVPSHGSRRFVPGVLFPKFTDRMQGTLSDTDERTELEYDYLHGGERLSMVWRRRSRSWNRSFRDRTGTQQPERALYLRTLANLSNPSEIRGVIQMMRTQYRSERLTAELLMGLPQNLWVEAKE